MQLYLDDFADSFLTNVIALIVLDGATWHRSPKLTVPDNLRLVFLPPYAPELNPAEHLWPLLREAVANQAFTDINALEQRLADRCAWLVQHPNTGPCMLNEGRGKAEFKVVNAGDEIETLAKAFPTATITL